MGGLSQFHSIAKSESETERGRKGKRGSDRWTRRSGVAGVRHVLGLVDHFHLCLSCNRSAGMNGQWIVCIQLPVGRADHLWRRWVLLKKTVKTLATINAKKPRKTGPAVMESFSGSKTITHQ